jgi:hypothetical protein
MTWWTVPSPRKSTIADECHMVMAFARGSTERASKCRRGDEGSEGSDPPSSLWATRQRLAISETRQTLAGLHVAPRRERGT